MTDFPADEQALLPDFKVSAVLGDTFRAILSNIIKITGISLLMYLPFFLVIFLFFSQAPTNLDDAFTPADAELMAYSMFGAFAVMMVAGFIAQTAIVHGAIESLANKPVTFKSMLSTAFRTFFPVLGASCIIMVLYFIGGLLLVVPGIIAAITLSVTVPVIVAEKKPVFAALKRSAELTRGNRWAILGALILVSLVSYVIMLVITFAGLLFAFLPEPIGGILSGLVSIATMAAFYGVFGASIAAIYTNLRAAKEGTSVDEIADVFA